MMFKEKIGKTMEVYVNDMLVKSKVASDHITHTAYMFKILRKYRMKLNPLNALLAWPPKSFWGSWSTNLEKIQALLDM